MLRASLADPELPNKIRDGRIDEINYCIGCLQGCLGANRRGESFSCMVRPLTGRAHEFDLTPVSSPKKIIVIGGGLVGAETADYLAVYGGRKVTILEMKPSIVADGEPNPNHFLLRSLRDHNVDVFVNTSISEIAEDGVHFTLDGEEHFVKADQVVISAGIRADGVLLKELETLGVKAISAGDANRGKNGLTNIYEGFLAGVRL